MLCVIIESSYDITEISSRLTILNHVPKNYDDLLIKEDLWWLNL